MSDSWIKLYRKFIDWEWFHKPEMVQLFIWLLLNAKYSEQPREGSTIECGQLVTTFPEMARETRLSMQKLRTCINRLKSTHEITCKSTNKYTTITICNYGCYQGAIQEINGQNNGQNNFQSTDKQRTNNALCTTICTNIERKKERNNNIIISARTREDDMVDTIKTEQMWLESMAMKHRYAIPDIIAKIDSFVLDCKCRDNRNHKDVSDLKQHFDNWLMKQPKATTNHNNKKVNDLWK